AVGTNRVSLLVEMRVRNECFGWNAAPVQAHTAILFLFDTNGLHPELGKSDGANVAAGATAEDNRFVLVGHEDANSEPSDLRQRGLSPSTNCLVSFRREHAAPRHLQGFQQELLVDPSRLAN